MGQVQLLYVSAARNSVSDSDLEKILATARRKNSTRDVTGMLLFCEGNFLQVLEGPADAVEATFQEISRDPRHTGVRVLMRRPISARGFADWSMGFERVKRDGIAGSDAVFGISRKAIEGHMTDDDCVQIRHFMETFYWVTTRAELDLGANVAKGRASRLAH